jgi:hypothetical protein
MMQTLVVPANDKNIQHTQSTLHFTITGPPRGTGNGDLIIFSDDDDDAGSVMGEHMEQAVNKVFRTITKHIKYIIYNI